MTSAVSWVLVLCILHECKLSLKSSGPLAAPKRNSEMWAGRSCPAPRCLSPRLPQHVTRELQGPLPGNARSVGPCGSHLLKNFRMRRIEHTPPPGTHGTLRRDSLVEDRVSPRSPRPWGGRARWGVRWANPSRQRLSSEARPAPTLGSVRRWLVVTARVLGTGCSQCPVGEAGDAQTAPTGEAAVRVSVEAGGRRGPLPAPPARIHLLQT